MKKITRIFLIFSLIFSGIIFTQEDTEKPENKNKKNIFFANMQKTMKTFQYYNFTDIKEGIKKTL